MLRKKTHLRQLRSVFQVYTPTVRLKPDTAHVTSACVDNLTFTPAAMRSGYEAHTVPPL